MREREREREVYLFERQGDLRREKIPKIVACKLSWLSELWPVLCSLEAFTAWAKPGHLPQAQTRACPPGKRAAPRLCFSWKDRTSGVAAYLVLIASIALQ